MYSKLFLLLNLLCAGFLVAGKNDTVIPEKWKNESAVILELWKEFRVTAGYKDEVIVKEKQKRQILLRDKAALASFSEIYIPVSEYDNTSWSFSGAGAETFKVLVHKKNGEAIELKNSDAIPMQMSNSRNFYWGAYTYMKKLAVPNLEIGDIIEYEYNTRSGGKAEVSGSTDLAELYPVLKLSVEFELPEAYHIMYSVVNSEDQPTASERQRGKGNRTLAIYRDTVTKWKDELWAYEAQTFPRMHFRIIYDPAFKFTEAGAYEKEVQTTLARYLFNNEMYKSNRHYVKKIKGYLKQNTKEGEGSFAIASKAWYYFRYLVIRDAVQAGTAGENVRISDEVFCAVMLEVLGDLKIPSKLVSYVPRDKGELQHAVSPWAYNIAVQVGEGEYNVLFNFGIYNTPEDTPPNCDGVKALAFTANKNYSKPKFRWLLAINPTFVVLPAVVYLTESAIKKSRRKTDAAQITIPKVAPAQNSLDTYAEIDLNILPAADSVSIRRTFKKSGNFKQEDNGQLLDAEFALAEDEQQLHVKKPERKPISFYEEKYRADVKTLREKKRKQYLSSELENDELTVLKYENYRLKSSGRYDISPALEVEEKFMLGNILSKPSADAFIVSAGLIIGSQVTLSEEDMERSYDAYFPYPRVIKNKITIKFPAGYAPVNLHDFNFNAESNSGKFTSSATMKDNIVVIETTKLYYKNTVKKEDWKKMTGWLDAAYHFTQKKLVFKKS